MPAIGDDGAVRADAILANLGAEEGSAWRRHLARPQVQALAGGFLSLFGSKTQVLELDALGLDQADLDAREPEPAWPFLADKRPGVSKLWPWLATEEAERIAAGLGLELAGPGAEVQAHVHDKAFAASALEQERLGPSSLRAASLVLTCRPEALAHETDQALERLRTWPSGFGGSWVLKPRWGTSGRGRRSGRGPEALEATLPKAASGLARRRGAVLEPWLERIDDFSVQLYVPRQGDVQLLGTTRQHLTPSGVYVGNTGTLDELGRPSAKSEHEPTLVKVGLCLGRRAQEAGFFGLCGTDAFTYRDENGHTVLRPLVELNARATGGVVLAGRLRRRWLAGTAKAGDRFRYDATEDQLRIV